MSEGSQVALSGICFITTAFLKPAFSKASFHFSPASLMIERYSKGVVFSIQNTIGSTGSLNLALGFFFFRSQRLIKSLYGVAPTEVRLSTSEPK
ncbi:hypothetical protein D3C87_516670 [compost metagenome]